MVDEQLPLLLEVGCAKTLMGSSRARNETNFATLEAVVDNIFETSLCENTETEEAMTSSDEAVLIARREEGPTYSPGHLEMVPDPVVPAAGRGSRLAPCQSCRDVGTTSRCRSGVFFGDQLGTRRELQLRSPN